MLTIDTAYWFILPCATSIVDDSLTDESTADGGVSDDILGLLAMRFSVILSRSDVLADGFQWHMIQ
jgi:hypothetical protein